MRRAALLLFFLGATVGTGLDAFHTHSGTTAYAHEVAFKMAWWTPFAFGLAGLVGGLAYPIASRVLGRLVAPEMTWARVLACFFAFGLMYWASGYLFVGSGIKLALLASGAVALGLSSARTSTAFALALVAAFVGSTVEIALVAAGKFRHASTDFLGIPMWLPALYAGGSFAFGVLGNEIVRALSHEGVARCSRGGAVSFS